MKIEITVKLELLAFSSWDHYVETSADEFVALIYNSNISENETISIDQKGKVVSCLKEYKYADYPIKVYLLEAPNE